MTALGVLGAFRAVDGRRRRDFYPGAASLPVRCVCYIIPEISPHSPAGSLPATRSDPRNSDNYASVFRYDSAVMMSSAIPSGGIAAHVGERQHRHGVEPTG